MTTTANRQLTFIKLNNYLKSIQLKHYFLLTIASLFIIALQYYSRHLAGDGLELPLNALTWIFASILIAIGFFKVINSQQILYTPFLLIMLLGCLLLFIPVLYGSETRWFSYSRILGLFSGLTLLFAIIQIQLKTADFHKILFFILIGLFLQNLLSLAQYYIFPHYPSLAVYAGDTPSGWFYQKNIAANLFVTAAVISLYLLQQTKNTFASKSYLTLLYLSTATLSASILIIQSRVAFFTFFVASTILLCTKNSVNKKWLAMVAFGSVITVLSLGSAITPTKDNNFQSQLISKTIPTRPTSIRTDIYKNTFELIAQKPFYGHGYGTFTQIYKELQAKKYTVNPENLILPLLSKPHNEVLYWWVEGGIIALLGVLVILGGIIYITFKQKEYSKLALLLPIALHTLTEYPFYHFALCFVIFLLLLAFLTNSDAKPYKFSITRLSQYAIKGGILIIPTITIILLLSLLNSQQLVHKAVSNANLQPLLKINLPLVSPRFERELNSVKFNNAIQTNNIIAIEDYMSWANKQNTVAPQAGYYFNLIKANLFLGDISEAQQILKKVQYLYPNKNWESTVKFVEFHSK
jgi:O-antigen polymerase